MNEGIKNLGAYYLFVVIKENMEPEQYLGCLGRLQFLYQHITLLNFTIFFVPLTPKQKQTNKNPERVVIKLLCMYFIVDYSSLKVIFICFN